MNGLPRRKSVAASFRYAASGFAYMWVRERNMRLHVFSAAVVLWLAGVLAVQRWEWVALILTVASVIALESLNTAIERAGDLPGGPTELARIAKDTAAAAVLTMAVAAVLVGLLVFGPRLVELPLAIRDRFAVHPIPTSLTLAAVLLVGGLALTTSERSLR